jgi:molecular chaperone GrpE
VGENKSENGIGSGGSPPPSQATEMGQEEALRAEADKFKNEYLYLRAEFENYKRNAVRERSDLLKYGSERVLNDVLNIADNFERALEVKISADNFQTYQKGVEMTASELKNVLQKFGVTEVPALGKVFDPTSHEALSSEETSQFPEGHVSRVFKKGYKLHDRMLRPAQVVVAKALTKKEG